MQDTSVNKKAETAVYSPEQKSHIREIISGLSKKQKTLPCKLFYDESGSLLFEQICSLNEYYLTRAELEIMNSRIEKIAEHMGPECILIEYGSGNSMKIRLLLDNLKRVAAYVPIDISYDHLKESNEALAAEYPSINIFPVCADYTQQFELPLLEVNWSRKVVYYPGSTIGNYTPAQALVYLNLIADIVGRDGVLLIGVDLKKDKQIIDAAYNDSKGITAEFNLNILKRLNQEFVADFDLRNWKHHAFYSEEQGRVEMHLVSRKDQTVSLDNLRFFFSEGETILTEYSYKYSLNEFADMVSPIYNVKHVWTDKDNLFSVQYLTVK